MNKPTKQSSAAKWMLEGIKQHESFERTFLAAKEHALNAGLFFLSARDGLEHGEWESFKVGYTHKVSARSIERYTEFATEVLEWVKVESPKLIGMEKISAAARQMVLKSPKGFIALCRELKLMRKFGEYDEVKYRAKKIKGSGEQIEFPFDEIFTSVVSISRLGQANFHLKLPAGKSEREAFEELKSNLQAALDSVNAQLLKTKTIEA